MRYLGKVTLSIIPLFMVILLSPERSEAACETVILQEAAWRCCYFRTRAAMCIPTDILC